MTLSDFSALFRTIMGQNGLDRFTDDAHCAAFYTLTTHMLEVNEHMNLTAIKEIDAVIARHFADSLAVEPYLPLGARVVDVGCGAGFPSLPLAICRPDLHILALDSTAKRIRYVAQTAELLGLGSIEARAARAEEVGKAELRERFDCCVARAVAALPALCELCLPLVRKGGIFLAMKAQKGEEEAENAARAIRTLGGAERARHEVALTLGETRENRLILEIEKVKHTPQAYPRAFAKISKAPL